MLLEFWFLILSKALLIPNRQSDRFYIEIEYHSSLRNTLTKQLS